MAKKVTKKDSKKIKPALFIKSLEFKKDYNPLKKGFRIDFKRRFTMLVGDNGVGKSTITDALGMLFGHDDDTYLKRKDKDVIEVEKEGEFKVKFIDFHGGDKKFAAAFGNDIGLQLQQQKASSGQVTLSLLMANKIGDVENSVLILDEPERGLSIKNQKALGILILKILLYTNCQIIMTCHSLLILSMINDLADYFLVSEQKYVTLKEYLKEQGYETETETEN